jgi:O-antigen/teichoic acid export membrane protein
MRQIKNNPLLKNIALLFTGTGIAQVIPFVASIWLARLYTQTDYGDLSVFMAITSIVGVIAALRYDCTIMLPKEKSDAQNLFALCVFNSLIIGFLSLIIILLFRPFFLAKLNLSNDSSLFLIPIMVVSTGIYLSFDNWFNRNGAFKKTATGKVIFSLVSNGAKILLGIAGVALGLIYGTVIGNIVLICILFCLLGSNEIRQFRVAVTWVKMKKMFVEFRDFFIYDAPGALLNTLSNIGLPLLIAYFYSVEYAGIYFFANTLIRQPIGLLSTSVSQVYKNEANKLYLNTRNELLKFTVKIQKTIFCLIFPILVIMSIIGGTVFGFVFGNQWVESGDMIKYFAIFVLFNANYAPISSIGDILRKQKFLLFFNLSLVVSQVVLLLLFSSKIEFRYMILMISLSSSLHYLYIDRYMKQSIKKIDVK